MEECMRSTILRSLAWTCVLGLFGSPVFAQQPADAAAIRAEVTRLREALDALEARLATLEGAAPPPAAPQAAAAVSPPAPSGAADTSKVFNPDTSVLAN